MADWVTDPEAVAGEYASDEAYRERALAFHELAEGPDEDEIVRERILAARPRRLLDVGSGLGDLCAWAKARLEAEVVAVDASPRMVELAAQAGVEAVLADMRHARRFPTPRSTAPSRAASSTTCPTPRPRSPSSRAS